MRDDQMDALTYTPQLWKKKRPRLSWLPALGFALGALAAWYWRLPVAVVAFLAVAAIGWCVVPREERP